MDDKHSCSITMYLCVEYQGHMRACADMCGSVLQAIRKSFLALFTRKALGIYVELQDGIVRAHIAKWLAETEGTEVEIRNYIRCGPFFSSSCHADPTARRSQMSVKEGFSAFLGRLHYHGRAELRKLA